MAAVMRVHVSGGEDLFMKNGCIIRRIPRGEKDGI
jgi:hypothetical protein